MVGSNRPDYLGHLVIWLVIPAATNGTANHANSTLALIVLVQYIPRSFIIFPLNQRIIKTTGFIAKTAWAGAAYNLLLYILASHVLGAMWYLSSIGRQFSCWSKLQERVRRFVQYKWLATRGVDEESILQSLPTDLRREIQRHLCLALVRRVPFFSQMDDQLLDAICGCLVSSLSTAGTYIFREGDPVDEMLFVIRGQIESSTTNGGRSGFFNSTTLRPGDFCGEELLTWALMPNSTLNFPSSTRSVRALSEVEAFALSAEDLKFVAHQFKRLQSKKLQHAFRYYSHQWRAWGACFVQSAWRRYKRRKLAKELSLHESSGYYYRDETGYNEEGDEENYYGSDDDDFEGERLSVDNTNNSQNLGATMLASKFAANTRRGTNQKASSSSSTGKKDGSSNSLKMPQLFKPDEPDFSMDKEDV
ncbi:hypothetical protein DY000_02018979 [Brassica cretica]|uniref:Cyclic nucleotide-binding domain-containing protein n=1 Tax=Brassica cretica TaxID=69181 RepID=A0ABQ7DAS3_BRACR|nr:hypothetical protein DY000_02018979 [Brassica cretica]